MEQDFNLQQDSELRFEVEGKSAEDVSLKVGCFGLALIVNFEAI